MEQALEPDLPICDPHHHLYGEGSVFYGPYSVADLRRDTGGHRVTSTVYVETQSGYRPSGSLLSMAPVGETEWVIEQAAGDDLVQGIIGYADLMIGDAAGDVLDAHAEAAGGRFRGVRVRDSNFNQPKPPPGWLTSPELRRGIRQLEQRDLILELFVLSPDLPDVLALARSCPDLPIVLDHIGTPPQPAFDPRLQGWTRDDVLDRWRQDMKALASCPNVVLKIGGIGMTFVTDAADIGPISSESIAAYWGADLRRLIELFGTGRSMFESNWPFDAHLCDLVTMWNVYKLVSRDGSPSERADLFHDTAVRVHRL
ncbi:MAG TPA: amidohydrolase family protein [Streptosporangiaceae bacterium]